MGQLEEQPIVALFQRVGLESNTHRSTLRRTVGDVEAAVMFWALDEVSFQQAVGEVGFAVGAGTGSGVVKAVICLIDSICLIAVIKTDYLTRTE